MEVTNTIKAVWKKTKHKTLLLSKKNDDVQLLRTQISNRNDNFHP